MGRAIGLATATARTAATAQQRMNPAARPEVPIGAYCLLIRPFDGMQTLHAVNGQMRGTRENSP